MKNFLSLKNKKTFSEDVGFYVFTLFVTFLIQIIPAFFVIPFLQEQISSEIIITILFTVYTAVSVILTSMILWKKGLLKNRYYFLLIIVAGWLTLTLGLFVGPIIPAFLTTVGPKNKDGSLEIV
jgi:hypothetical protein